MCRSIKPLFNFDPVVTDDEIHAAALQFVRKVSGFHEPSAVNEQAFYAAVDEVTEVSKKLMGALETKAPPKNREQERQKAHLRAAKRKLF